MLGRRVKMMLHDVKGPSLWHTADKISCHWRKSLLMAGERNRLSCKGNIWLLQLTSNWKEMKKNVLSLYFVKQRNFYSSYFVIWYNINGNEHLEFVTHPFNLHPEKWFEGYPVKSTQIFIGCHLRFVRVASTQIFLGCSPDFFSDLQAWHPTFFKLPP